MNIIIFFVWILGGALITVASCAYFEHYIKIINNDIEEGPDYSHPWHEDKVPFILKEVNAGRFILGAILGPFSIFFLIQLLILYPNIRSAASQVLIRILSN